jgi:D-amino peptidase
MTEMKVFIITDLEGPALISRFNQTRDVTPEEKPRWMRLLTGEVNACIDGILDFDPNAEVVAWDGHGSGGIVEELFHRDAKLIARGPISAPYGLDETYQALMFVGQHAMMGDRGVLCHTYSSKSIEYYRINDVEMGEFGCRALMAGTMGVPTTLVTGDDVTFEEARALVPEIQGAVVKWAMGRELALHLSHEAACDVIRVQARLACERTNHIEPYFFAGPYTQEVRYLEGVEVSVADGWERVDDRTIRRTEDDITKLRV